MLNTVVLIEFIFTALWAFIIVFVANEMGQRFSDLFIELDDFVSQLNWYLLSIKLQRMAPIIIINVKQPVAIKFFGSYSCCREQFKKARTY